MRIPKEKLNDGAVEGANPVVQKKAAHRGINFVDNRPLNKIASKSCNSDINPMAGSGRSIPVQLGKQEEWHSIKDRKKVRDLGPVGRGESYLTSGGDGKNFYVEAWIRQGKQIHYAGAVNIDVQGDGIIAMHTTSEKGSAGGLALMMFEPAVRLIASGIFGEVTEIHMTPAPGAASKKVIELLSSKFGDEDIHGAAEEERDRRKRSGARRDPSIGLNDWDPAVIEEHHHHLEALHASNPAGLEIMSGGGWLTGPAREELPDTPEAKIGRIRENSKEADGGVEGGYGINLKGEALERMLGE